MFAHFSQKTKLIFFVESGSHEIDLHHAPAITRLQREDSNGIIYPIGIDPVSVSHV